MDYTEIEKARGRRGWTQEQLAAAAGVSRFTILRAEKGTPPSRYITRVRLAKALDLEPEDLWPREQAS